MTRRRLAALAVAGPALFVSLLALLHVLQSETNDTDAISDYALGDYGLLANAAFVAAGIGFAALAGTLAGGRVQVRFVVEESDPSMATVAISQILLPAQLPVPPQWQIVIASTFLPGHTPPEDLSFTGDIAGEPLRQDEIAYCDFAEDEPEE